MHRKYTDQEFINAVKNSTSIRQTLIKLNLKPAGGNYYTFHTNAKRLSPDTSHFKGHGWSKGRKFGPKRPIEHYLANKSPISSFKLKNRLIKEGYFVKKCYKCELTKWNGKPIPLELEHIDGNHENNNLSNLTLLCPNCHAQTDTYRGKNKKRKSKKLGSALSSSKTSPSLKAST